MEGARDPATPAGGGTGSPVAGVAVAAVGAAVPATAPADGAVVEEAATFATVGAAVDVRRGTTVGEPGLWLE